MITHLRIQRTLGVGLSTLVLLYHFFTRVWPAFSFPISAFDRVRALPYLVAIAAFLYGTYIRNDRDRAYAEFIKNSPGIDVETQGITYASGHGFDRTSGG